MARGLEPAGVEFIAENLDSYIKDLSKADKAQLGLGDSAEKSSGGLKILSGVVTGVATAVTTFAIDAVAKAGQALVGLAQDSIGVAAEFQSMETRLIIAAGSAGQAADQFGGLGEVALAVGGDTRLMGVSATGAADAMTGLLKAGIPLGDVMGDLNAYMGEGAELGGLLRASIDLAAATELDMVEASNLASITMATFSMTTDEAAAAMDYMVRAADASVAEVSGLRDAMANVGSAAASMGISFEDVTTSLAILSTRGIQGAEAGTALKSMMTNLMRITPKVTEALEAQGIALYDNSGAMYSIPEIIGQFQIATEAMTEAERNQFIQTVAGTYGMKSLATFLSNEGVEGYRDMEEAIASATGIQAQAEAQSKTYAAQQEALDGVMETLKIRIGTALLPALTSITSAFSGIVEEYGPLLVGAFESIGSALSESLPQAIEGIMNLLSGDFEGAMWNFASVISKIFGRDAAVSFMKFSTKAEEIFNKVKGVVEEVIEIFGKVKAAFQFEGLAGAAAQLDLAQTLGLDPKVIATIVGIPDKIVEAFGKIQEWFATNGPAIESALGQIGQVYMAVFGSIWEVIQDSVIPALKEVWGVFQETWKVIREVLEELGVEFDESGSGIETFANVIMVVVETSGGIIAGVLNAIVGAVKFFAEHFQDVWKGIRDVIQGVKEWFEGFKQFWTALFNDDMPGALEGLEKGFGGFAKFIKGMMKVIVKSITMPFEGLYKLIEGFVEGVIKFFKDLKKKLVGGSIIPDMMDKIEKVIDTVLEVILKIWEKVFEKILDVTQDIFESIERTVDRVMTTVEKIIDTITTAIGGDWEDFVDLLFELWEETWNDIRDAVDTIFSAVEALIDRIAGSIESLWDSFTETLEQVWENAWNAIQDAVDSIFSAIEALVASIISTIETNWSAFTDTLQQVWSTTWEAIQNAVDTILSAIESLMDSISSSITSAWESFTSGIQATWETVWSAIQSFVDTTFNAIAGLIDSISGSIESAWGTFTSAVQSTWETVWSAIESFVNTTFNNVQAAISTISSAIEGIWNSWIGRLRSAFETMFNALEGIVNTAMGLVRDAVDSALSALASILAVGSNLYNGIMTIGHNIANAVRDGVVALWGNVKSALAAALEALGAVGAFAGQVWEAVKELGRNIVYRIKEGLSNVWATATGVVGALRIRLEGLADALGSVWSSVAAIGAKVVDWIKQGIINAWGSFVAWLKSMVIGIFGGSEPTDLQSPFRRDKLRDAGDWIGRTMVESIEMGMLRASSGFSASLGMVAPAMMAPAAVSRSTAVNIGPVAINNGMDVAEFETRVRQAVSEAI